MKTPEKRSALRGTEKSDQTYYLRNAVLLFSLLLFTGISMLSGNILYKALASFSFVAAGAFNYFCNNRQEKSFSRMLIGGLICGFFGDVGIMLDFRLGALFFAVGHVLYYLSFRRLCPASGKSLWPAGIFFLIAAAAIGLVQPPETSAFMRCVCFIYAVIISLMSGKSVSTHFALRNRLSRLLVIGCITFFLSDLMVLFAEFIPEKSILFTDLCRSLYFPAQFLLAQAPSVRAVPAAELSSAE